MANYRVLGEIADSIEFQRRIRIAAGVVSSQVYVEVAYWWRDENFYGGVT